METFVRFSLLIALMIPCLHALAIEDGLSMKSRGDYQNAILVFLEVKKKNYTVELLYNMADCAEKMQDFTMAAIYYQELNASFPGSQYEELAKNKLKNLMQIYLEKDVINPVAAGVEELLNLGIMALNNDQIHRAIVLFLKGFQMNPSVYLFAFHLGWCYQTLYTETPSRTEYRDASINYFVKASKIAPNAKVFNNLACIFAKANDPILAQLYFEKAYKHSSSPALQKLVEQNEKHFSSGANASDYKFLKEASQ